MGLQLRLDGLVGFGGNSSAAVGGRVTRNRRLGAGRKLRFDGVIGGRGNTLGPSEDTLVTRGSGFEGGSRTCSHGSDFGCSDGLQFGLLKIDFGDSISNYGLYERFEFIGPLKLDRFGNGFGDFLSDTCHERFEIGESELEFEILTDSTRF